MKHKDKKMPQTELAFWKNQPRGVFDPNPHIETCGSFENIHSAKKISLTRLTSIDPVYHSAWYDVSTEKGNIGYYKKHLYPSDTEFLTKYGTFKRISEPLLNFTSSSLDNGQIHLNGESLFFYKTSKTGLFRKETTYTDKQNIEYTLTKNAVKRGSFDFVTKDKKVVISGKRFKDRPPVHTFNLYIPKDVEITEDVAAILYVLLNMLFLPVLDMAVPI